MDFYQLGIFILQGTLVAGLIQFLFRIRKTMGLGMLFACLGLFQFMQVFLAIGIYVKITDGILVSFASVLFTASLFALLLIYIKEDANETKKVIYALIASNIVIALILYSLNLNLEVANTYNPYNITTRLMNVKAKVLVFGTFVLFLDVLLIILFYEFISKVTKSLFLRILSTMVLVVAVDSLLFNAMTFWGRENLNNIITSSIIAKSVTAFFYSILFTFYLKRLEPSSKEDTLSSVKDIFKTLSYKEKYKLIAKEAKKANLEIQEKELRFRTLTAVTPVGIWHAKPDGEMTYVNRKYLEISGLTTQEIEAQQWQKAIHPEDMGRIQHCWVKAMESKGVTEAEYRFVHKDGSVRWVLGSATPETDTKGNILGFVGTVTDITNQKLYEDQLTQLKNKAEESNRLKSAFLANMSHEIRTPMNGILGFADLLKSPNLSGEEQQEFVDIIKKSGHRMLNIINDIINISRLEAGTMEINSDFFDVNGLLKYKLDFFGPEAAAKNLSLSCDLKPPLEHLIVKGDKDKVCSILTNLIKNAIKYTDKGSIHFGYYIKKQDLIFYVKDTGIGIEESKHKAVFERFVQADIEDKMARQGAGLGLSISKAYANLMGGDVWLESEFDKGSSFYLSIPFIPQQQKTA